MDPIPQVGEWQRSKEYQDVMLRQIAEAMLRDPKAPKAGQKEVCLLTDNKLIHLPKPRGENEFHVFASENNPGAAAVLEEVQAFIRENARLAKRVKDPEQVEVADRKEELGSFQRDENSGTDTGNVQPGSRKCEAMLLHLNKVS